MGCDWRLQVQQSHLHQEANAPAEGQGELGTVVWGEGPQHTSLFEGVVLREVPPISPWRPVLEWGWFHWPSTTW